MNTQKIVTIEKKTEERFLREQTQLFPIEDLKDKKKSKEIQTLVKRMRETMKRAEGVGLSANQVGIPYRFFVAQVPNSQGKQKFYAIFNPEISKTSEEKITIEEGCLSVPKTYGPVERYYRVLLTGYDPKGKRVRIKAWGLLSRVFQHEVDHLEGKLFIDRAKRFHTYEFETIKDGK